MVLNEHEQMQVVCLRAMSGSLQIAASSLSKVSRSLEDSQGVLTREVSNQREQLEHLPFSNQQSKTLHNALGGMHDARDAIQSNTESISRVANNLTQQDEMITSFIRTLEKKSRQSNAEGIDEEEIKRFVKEQEAIKSEISDVAANTQHMITKFAEFDDEYSKTLSRIAENNNYEEYDNIRFDEILAQTKEAQSGLDVAITSSALFTQILEVLADE